VNSAPIVVQDRQVTALFASLAAFGRDPSPALGEIGDAVAQSTRLRFDAGVDPRGQKWQALAWATVLKRASRGRSMRRGGKLVTRSGIFRARFQRQVAGNAQPLRDTSTNLFNTITHRVEGKYAVVIGVAPAWARIHQFGGQAGRGRKVRIPKREIFGITIEDRREITSLLGNHLVAAVRAAAPGVGLT
jgi:phage gpG-like protein